MNDIHKHELFADWAAGVVGSDLLSPIAETWKPVPGYDVSNFGRLRSLKGRRIRIIRQQTNIHGYRVACLSHKGVARTRRIHHLVLEAFVGARPEGMLGRHLNDDAHDNRIENLAWGTFAENEDDRRRNGGTQRLQRLNR